MENMHTPLRLDYILKGGIPSLAVWLEEVYEPFENDPPYSY